MKAIEIESMNEDSSTDSAITTKTKPNKKRSIKKEMLKLGIFVILFALLFSPLNLPFANFMLFHPQKEMEIHEPTMALLQDKFNAKWKKVSFPSKNGNMLSAWFWTIPDSKGTMLVSHGNAGNLSHRVHLLAPIMGSGYSVFLYDYQGYGESQGKSDHNSIIEDGLAAYDYLIKEQSLTAKDIVLYGESLGCAVSSAVLQARDAKAVILQSCFSSAPNASRDKFHWTILYPDFVFPQKNLDNITVYTKPHPPLLLLHGENDFILPAKYAKEVFEKAIEPKEIAIVKTCGHNDFYIANAAEGIAGLQGFLKKLN
ncbi:MAG: alpha/beta hydrolase [Candidatus Obscuribacterales bacterium]|nr:alpha/beta hydrolase [Candidatus Obscuribacterales bacterium]